MTQANLVPSVSLINGRPATTSLQIAEHFGKQHPHVLRSIQDLIANTPETFNASNFGLVEYTDAKGEKRPMYTVYFDGFVLLVMGYTGKKALQIKLAYIAAFNAMRERLEAQPLQNMQPLPDTLTPSLRAELKALVDSKLSTHPAAVQGKARSEIWSRFNRHFKIAEYAQLPAKLMPEAREYLIGMEVKALKPLPSPTVAKNATTGIAGGELVPDDTPEVLTVFNDRDVFQRVRASVEEARRGMDKAFRELDELALFMQRKHMAGYDPAKLRKGGAIAQMGYAFKEHWDTAICSLNAAVHTVRAMQAVDEL